MKKKLKNLLGFRSNVPWKMLVAVVYYAATLVFLWIGMTTPIPYEAGTYDQVIYRICVVIIFVGLLSPAIFLSNTKMRKYLPLFRMRVGSMSFLGMMIVFLLFVYLFAAVDDLHTPAYKQAYNNYYEALYEAYEATQGAQAE